MQLADIGRNEPCLCGSGRKYKKCCLAREGAASSVDPEVAAAVDRAIEDDDWEPLYDPIATAMTLFEPGAPLEHVRFGEVQMLPRMPDRAEIAQLCTGGWLRGCEREIAYVLGRFPLAAAERDGLRLAAYLLRRFGALSPTVDEIVKLQVDERVERLRRLATAISAQGFTLEAVMAGCADLRAWLERIRPTVLSFAQWFALRTVPDELLDELWSFNAAARIGEACLDRLEDPALQDPPFWLDLAVAVLLTNVPMVGRMLSRITAPHRVTDAERMMYEAVVHKRTGEALRGIMHRILHETEDHEAFADAALLRAAMQSVQSEWR